MTRTTPASIGTGDPSRAPRRRFAPIGGSRPRTAFVLSGGGSLAAAQVGMLQALYEHQIEPDVLVGTSTGALNAAFAASRPPTAATARQLGRIWSDLSREDVFPVSMTALVGGVCGRRDHLVPDRGLRALVRRCLEFDDLADAAIPLHVVVFDQIAGREVLLSEGRALDAIAASMSIPGIYPPSPSANNGSSTGVLSTTPRSPMPSRWARKRSTCFRRRIHASRSHARRRPRSMPRSTVLASSVPAGSRLTWPDTRARPSWLSCPHRTRPASSQRALSTGAR